MRNGTPVSHKFTMVPRTNPTPHPSERTKHLYQAWCLVWPPPPERRLEAWLLTGVSDLYWWLARRFRVMHMLIG